MDIRIHEIGSYVVRNYLLETPRGIIAIDTGYPGDCDRFVRRFEKVAPLSALTYIFITHHHDDHAGFLADLLARCDAKVVLHPLAIEPLSRGESLDHPDGGYSSVPASWFGKFKSDFTFPKVNLGDKAVIVGQETDQVFERLGLPIRILFLPGHTADSIGLFLTETGQLFCGDAAMNAIISVAKHTIWIDDADAFGQSWDAMLATRPTRIYPSHGGSFSPKALVRHRHYMKGRKLIQLDKKSK
ncbi:MAG: MBL fold metallo-hydrolase [Sphaerochaetaceae bacterium]|jgi:glyoxylase-like metal-dependent hydrolase (beta-lactamase superfamily II)